MKTNESQRSTLFKGLRLKSPTNQHMGEEQQPDQLQRTSPLRTGFAATQQFADAQSFSEIQPLENQTELLRREIQAKEAVLDRITESKDRLRMRISNTLGLNGNAATAGVNLRQKTLANSISQTSIYGQDLYNTNQDRNRDLTPPSREYNRKSTSPLRQQPRFPNNQPTESFQSLQQQSSVKEVNFNSFPNKQQTRTPIQANLMMQSDSLQQLQTDNSQLQRRLNLVVAELDRMNREKHQQQQQLGALNDETEYFRKAVEDEQRPDKSTDLLHEEIFVSRDQNRKVQNEILQVDRERQDAVNQLRIYQAERERRVLNCEDLSSGLQNKLAIMKNIETEILHSKEQMERINNQIRSIERKLKDEDRTNQDIQNLLNRLQRERDDLHIKLGQLSQNYDNAVAELSKERLLLESHNKRHMQLLSSKAIFSSLLKMSQDRKQYVFNEIASYCKFDNNCHRALNQFSLVLKSCGHYQMRIGLKRWFQNALKPLQTRQQGLQLTNDLYFYKLKSKAFHKWINKRQRIGQFMSSKGKAAQLICQKLVQWQQVDLTASLTRWRDLLKLQQQREKRLRVIIGRQYNNKRRQCFQFWFAQTTHLNLQMRLHILAKESASKHLLLICYSKFHKHTLARKQSRLMKIKHVLKAWRDGVAYRKYMMAQNVAASHMRKQLNQKLLLACLCELRSNKELSKLDIVKANLDSVVQPAIQALIQDIEDQAEKELRQRKIRGLTCISNTLNTALKSYLTHWRNVAEWSKIKITTNMKQMIISLYKNKLQRAFNHWNNNRHFRARSHQEEQVILQLQTQKSTLSTQITSLTSNITNEDLRIDLNTKSRLIRATEILKRRLYTHYLKRWSRRNQLMKCQENEAQFVIKKLRNIICRQAFAIYKAKVKQSRQNDLDQARADYFIETRRLRKLRQIYNAFCQYHTSYINQKKNIEMAVTSIDIYLQRKAFFKWCDKGNLKRVQLLADTQNQETVTFDSLNRNLGVCSGQLSDQVAVNRQLKADLMLQAQRVLANAFQRYYYIKAQRGIQQWVKVVEHQRHLEDILKRQIQHLQKSMFYQVKAAFQNWIAQSKITETKAEIVHTQFMIADAIQKTQFNRETHENAIQDFNIQTQETVVEIQEKTVKMNSSIQKIIQRNDQCHYQSRIRHIFNTWSAFTERQKRFCKAVERVVSKSLYQQGFSNINAFSRDKQLTRHQNSSLQQMRRMFWRKNCEKAIALWNSRTFDQLKVEVQLTNDAIQQEDQQFSSKVEQIKQQNCSNGNATMYRQKKQKQLIQTWRYAIMWEKSIRQRTLQLSDSSRNEETRSAIKKWRERSQITVRTRNLTQKFKLRLACLTKSSVFTAMVSNFRNTKAFLTNLSNIAAKFDHRMKENTLEIIQKFAQSRHESNCLDKEVAVKNVYNCLHQLYLRRMTSNLSCLKSKMMVQKRKNKKIGNMLGHFYTRQLRETFLKWKNQAHFESTVVEVNEMGPVVEEVLHFQIECSALVSFMNDQAYSPKEIEQAVQISENQAAEQMAKSISRMQHFTQQDDLYLKPKMFDRWKLFVKMRKLMRYILRNTENKLKPINADMSIAFNRWKFASGQMFHIQHQKHQDLNGVDRARLVARSANNNQRLNELNQLVDQGDTFMGHMSVQRDELVDNYIKSQRLAIALARDNLDKGMRRSLNQMDTNAHMSKRRDFETLLDRNINLIASLKERIQDFENDNVAVANENEELRQFSLDGYQIAKNVQSLSNERERLSVDLADKANIIKKLLSENEQLQSSLRQAQEHAVVLVHESQNTMKRLQQQRPLDYY